MLPICSEMSKGTWVLSLGVFDWLEQREDISNSQLIFR